MTKRAARLRKMLVQSRRTSEQTQRSFLHAEDQLTDLEQFEGRQSERQQRLSADAAERMPATSPERRGH